MDETPPTHDHDGVRTDDDTGEHGDRRDRADRVHTEGLRDYTAFRRSVADRKVAGVAGGLGRHLNIDPTILRVLFVVLCFFGGAGFLLYGVAWLLVPEDGRDQAVVRTQDSTRNGVLIGAGVLALALFVGDAWGDVGFPWPLALVALVVLLVVMNRQSSPGGDQTTQQPARPGTPPTPAGASAYHEHGPATWTSAPAPPPAPDRGPLLFWGTLALVAIALGTLGLDDMLGGGVAAAAYPALALAVTGVALVVAAWVGRGGGLVLLGILAALALVVTSAVAAVPDLTGRRVDDAPARAALVRAHYFVPAGTIRLDLTRVADVAALDGRTITARTRAGRVVVVLPHDLGAHLVGDVAVAGDITAAGQTSNGLRVHLERDIDGADGSGRVDLDLGVYVGDIEVRQS